MLQFRTARLVTGRLFVPLSSAVLWLTGSWVSQYIRDEALGAIGVRLTSEAWQTTVPARQHGPEEALDAMEKGGLTVEPAGSGLGQSWRRAG